jgi:hypothetical protein
MKLIRPTQLTQHRLKRLAAWAMLMLAWIGWAVFGNAPAQNRRRIRQRYGVRLDLMARQIYAMIVLHAALKLNLRRRAPTFRRSWAPHGFRHRSPMRHVLRRIIGAKLRKCLYARDPLKRIALLIAALRDLDAFAAKLMARLARGLTRVGAMIATHPPAEALRSCAAPQAFAVDSS